MNTIYTSTFQHIGPGQFTLLVLGVLIFILVPIVIVLIWSKKKKEPISTILIGAAVFLLFALILEKPIQNSIVFPTAIGLPEHAVSIFLNEHPVLLALVAALFPGVFEETGRLVAYKTILRKCKNKETSITYGIGHGGFEVLFILGMTYITYFAYGFMINSGTFQTIVDRVTAQSPDQMSALYDLAGKLATFSFNDLCIDVVERIAAFSFHVGASVLVFYACRDKKRVWLYPLAILIHTVFDFTIALFMFNVIPISKWEMEGIIAIIGLITLFSALFLIYKRDNTFFTSENKRNNVLKRQ